MKVGDLVKMDFENDDEFHPDEWGVGVIVTIDPTPPGTAFGNTEIEILWSKIGALSWEIAHMLELVNENR